MTFPSVDDLSISNSSLGEGVRQRAVGAICSALSVESLSYSLLSGIVCSRYPSFAVVCSKSWALCLDNVDFLLSKSIACEIKDSQNVLGDFLKCFEKGVHPMDGCFVELRFQMISSIAAFGVGLRSLNDFAISFALTL